MNDLAALERIVLEDLLDPKPGLCQDVVLLRGLEARGLVAQDGDRWVLTPAGRMELWAQTVAGSFDRVE